MNEEAGAMRRGKAVTLFTTDQAVCPDLRMTREAFSTKVGGTPNRHPSDTRSCYGSVTVERLVTTSTSPLATGPKICT